MALWSHSEKAEKNTSKGCLLLYLQTNPVTVKLVPQQYTKFQILFYSNCENSCALIGSCLL